MTYCIVSSFWYKDFIDIYYICNHLIWIKSDQGVLCGLFKEDCDNLLMWKQAAWVAMIARPEKCVKQIKSIIIDSVCISAYGEVTDLDSCNM